jgi:Ca2+-binding EF-hand superfamily protein
MAYSRISTRALNFAIRSRNYNQNQQNNQNNQNSYNSHNNDSKQNPFFNLKTILPSGLLFATAIVIAEENEKKTKNPSINNSQIKQINYQNRIRRFSTPDKVFRLFATIQVVHHNDHGVAHDEIYMTAEDFVRSITPGDIQPDKLGLDQYNKVHDEKLSKYIEKHVKPKKPSGLTSETLSGTIPESIFSQISENGLLSFSDYIFLITVLSTSARHWRILFKVFDQNGDGEVDKKEFRRVMKLAQKNTATGDRHRDTGSSTCKDILRKNSAICNYFYPNEDHKLNLNQFLEFHKKLRSEILRVQFNRERPNSEGKISKLSFAKMLLEYVENADTYVELDRVKKYLSNAKSKKEGISYSQVESLYTVLSNIDDIEMSLDMHTSAGIELSKDTFKHVAHVVADEIIDDATLDVMWAVFDVDNSGGLSNKEFLKQIKGKASFGLEESKDTGFWRLISSLWTCTQKLIADRLE